MSLEFFVVPEIALLGWFVLNRRAARNIALAHSGEDVMLQSLRDYLQDGYEVGSRAALLELTKSVSERAFQCKRQLFFRPSRDGGWKCDERAVSFEESSLLSAIAAQGQPIDRGSKKNALSPELLGAAFRLMDENGINVLVPVSDSMAPQWIWASYCAASSWSSTVDALQAWQMAMESIVERWALRLASAHLAQLEKDAASATQVLRVLLPEEPVDSEEGLEWAGTLRRPSGEPPVLFATYAQAKGKVLVVFAEVTTPGLAAVILASALRGYCDSLVTAARGATLRPEKVLGLLNRYVWRPGGASDLSCIVALFDTNSGWVDYASAGTPSWIHVKDGGSLVPITSTSPGLGVAEDIDYLPQKLALNKDDSHLFVGTELGYDICGDARFAQQASTQRSVGFANLGRLVDDLASAIDQRGEGKGRTPALIMFRHRGN